MRKQNDALLQRGKYRLVYDRRADGALRTPYIQIQWYDEDARRVRSRSTGTTCLDDAERQLDALYLATEKGKAVCPACGQPLTGSDTYLVTDAIEAYIEARKGRSSISAIRPRLGHVLTYLIENNLAATLCSAVDEDWIEEFREWNILIPVEDGSGATRERAPGTVEASVRQLGAVINLAKQKGHTLKSAQFKPKKPAEVSHTPTYRASIAELAELFSYSSAPAAKDGESDRSYTKRVAGRYQLLRFLQISVATWARPDAAHDVSTDPKHGQWDSQRRRLNLNPRGRSQTRKYRPVVPIAHQVAPLLDETNGYFVSVVSVRQAFEAMQDAVGLPGDREAGLKPIRRSMAQLGRERLGRAGWIEGKYMLGHHRPDPSDLYGIDEPGDYPAALRVTEQIIDEIIALAPSAFAPRSSSTKENRCD